MAQFVHLHVHTQYSILDGAASVGSLIKQAKKYDMPAIAITDHGNMFGVKEFYDKATKEGIKPILGCEAYVTRDHTVHSPESGNRYHLILLAKNEKGYHNLIKLISIGYTEGFYYRPRIDEKLLEEYHEGIICCSACLGGEVPKAIMNGNIEEASRVIEWYKNLFGEDYYLELQLHKPQDPTKPHDTYENQLRVNKVLIELAAKHGVKLIASNDVHFTLQDDATAHDHLICLNTRKDIDDPTRMRYTGEEYFKSPEEMEALFSDLPEALANTLEIAEKVEEYKLDRGPLMPNFMLPEDFVIDKAKLKESFLKKITDEELKAKIEAAEDLEAFVAGDAQLEENLTVAKQFLYLTHLSYEGCRMRYGDSFDEKKKERLDYELSTIERMGFPGYFLIVWDYIRAAREMGVSVGPGRGSAAGSVVAYALKITNIDPIKYDLLFERFLNPDRISLPDVDVDFDEDGRADVLNYVIEKYGQKRVAQIITFGKMLPKMAIRDVARVQKLSLQESDRIAKLVPDKIAAEKGETQFERLYKDVPELRKEKESPNELVKNTLKYAEQLEGSIRQTGVHACGVIIGQDDLEKFAPIATAKDADLNVVQFEGKFVESVGLIKMDFLGLKTLSIIKDAVANIKRTRGIDIDIDSIPLDDAKTYELFSHGDTTGIFQFESAGMKKYLRALKPTRLDDLIAMNALYRPGPMDKIPNFIDRKQGREPVTYEFPEMEKYLADTYGITVYQEQVMLLSQLLAGFTGGQADTLRKAMGKKQRAVLDKMKPQFIEGAVERGHDPKICEDIWGQWEAFASYAFNKSHATCYAYVAYQTAWLKAHYPAEFMAALMSRNSSSIDKVTIFMDESKRMGLRVLGPDVNESIHVFSADKNGIIRFGMAAIKGVGEAAVKSIVHEREKNGKFKDIYDFMERIDFQAVNRKTIENIILSGGLDSILSMHRGKLLTPHPKDPQGPVFLDQLMKYGSNVQNERNNAQQSLFGGGSHVDIVRPLAQNLPDWTQLETLNKEREVIGLFLSSHPLDDYAPIVKNMCNTTLTQFANLNDLKGREFTIAGMVIGAANLYTKTGRPFGKFTFEDYSGTHEFTLFDKDYENFRKFLYPEYFLMIRGSVKPRKFNENEFEVKINSMMQLDEVQETLLKEIVLNINIEDITPELMEALESNVAGSEGNTQLKIRINDPR
ncbi:MAG: DNA polymerase III subunit alpha, partial [Tidjanibacter sp.]|nr:DNA polymerase III subunit alpha [Tidjanibacter sp.]